LDVGRQANPRRIASPWVMPRALLGQFALSLGQFASGLGQFQLELGHDYPKPRDLSLS